MDFSPIQKSQILVEESSQTKNPKQITSNIDCYSAGNNSLLVLYLLLSLTYKSMQGTFQIQRKIQFWLRTCYSCKNRNTEKDNGHFS